MLVGIQGAGIYPRSLVTSGDWTPVDFGADLKLWLRPEDLLSANRWLRTEDLTHSAWNHVSVSAAGGQSDPDGGSNAFLLTATALNGSITQAAQGYQGGASDNVSWWWKRGPSHNGTSTSRIRCFDGVGTPYDSTDVVPPATWTRFDQAYTLNAAATKSEVELRVDTATTDQAVLMYHPQLELGTSASDYAANTTLAAGQLTNWPDASGSGNDMDQSTSASMPLVEEGWVDGYPAVKLDGVDDSMIAALEVAYSGEAFMYMIGQRDNNTKTHNVLGGSEVDERPFILHNGRYLSNHTKGLDFEPSAGVSPQWTDSTQMYVAQGRDATDEWYVWANGTAYNDGTIRAGDLHWQHFAERGADELPGYVAEVMFLNAYPSAAEFTSLHAYLSAKYPTLTFPS
jgi:hypothetical protein